MKKRLMSLLLSAAMIFSMAVVPAGASENITLTVDSVSAMPGEEVDVNVSISGMSSSIGSFGFSVAYDNESLEVVNPSAPVTVGTAWVGLIMYGVDNGEAVNVGCMSTAGSFTGNGVIATLKFKVKDTVSVNAVDLTATITEINMPDYSECTSERTAVDGKIDIIYPATATTGEPQQTSITSAILNGSYTALDGVTVSASGIKWGTAEDALNNTVDFGAEVTGTEGSTIYYQAYATVAGVDYVGEIKSITLDGPKASEIEIAGAESITVTLADSQTTYTAAVKDQFGADYAADVTWSMDAYEGVSIDNGVVTVTKDAQSGTVTITATAGEASDTFDITITRPAPVVSEITIAADDSINVPTAAVGEATVELTATGVDQFNETITLTDVDWSISKADGVSIKDNVITVTNKAAAGTVTVTAKVGKVEDTFELTINKAASAATAIEISGSEKGDIMPDQANTLTYTAVVTDQFGDVMTPAITWTTNSADVTIADGVLTIPALIKSQTVTITAAVDSISDTFDVALTRLGAVADKVEISGSSALTLPDLATKTVTASFSAVVTDNYGDVMPGAEIEWAVPMMDGVSIAEDGTLTVTTEAGEVDFTVYAQCNMARGEFPVSIKKAASVATAISFAEDTATMTIPTDDNNKVETFTAAVTDQYGVEMPAEIAYTFATADEFVTADKNTVTVKKGATAGTTYTLTATSGTLTDTLTITVVNIEINWDYTVATDAVYGDSWSDIVKLGKNGSASLEGNTVAGKFEIVDADVVPGAGEQPFTLKFISDDGVYVVTKTDVANIAKQVVTVKWTGYKGLTYGDPININATSDVELTTSEVKSNAGTHTVTASIAKASDAANYELDDTAALEYTIAKAKATITVPAQTIRASKTSEQLAAQIGTIQADGVNGEKLDGILTVTDDISGKTPSTKAQKVKVSFAHTNENYETPVSGTVMVTFTEGDPQEISVNSVNATYGDAAVANAATVTKGGTGAITYASDNDSVATVADDGSVNIVGVGTATVTVTVAAEGDWAETSTTYAVTVAPKAVTVSGITAADKVYDATTDAVVDVTNAVVEGKVGEDDVTVASAKGAFADANVGEGKDVAITDIVLTGAAVKNYVLSDAAVSATAKITKADPTIEFEGLKQKPGNVEAVTAVVTPASEGVTVVVEYYIAPVEEVACDHVGDKLCTTDGSACQHTDCGCSYVAPADGYWTTDVSLIQEKGEYPVRAYTEGDANLNAITVENAVTDTLVVKKSSSGGGGGSVVEPPVVEPEISFADVTEDDWFYDYVIEAVENGLFAGTDEDHFSPDMQMNRAMMVTVMAALEFGAEGAPEGESDFTDLTADWYKNAVAWAADEKVTAGISDTEFGPDLALTREQVAVFLYAYAQLKGYDVSSGSINDIVSFNDIADLSDWATTAMQWACAEGLLEGTPEGDLLPKAVATRAQVAVILTNFEKMIND